MSALLTLMKNIRLVLEDDEHEAIREIMERYNITSYREYMVSGIKPKKKVKKK